jgi:beta-glucosidase-like glycosyl hydrolase
LLTGILREKWGWNGYVISDAGAIKVRLWVILLHRLVCGLGSCPCLHGQRSGLLRSTDCLVRCAVGLGLVPSQPQFIETDHEWASSQPEAAADALHAGADLALGGGCDPANQPPGCISFGALGNATKLGLVTTAEIDTAVGRVLRVRFRLGLMDPPSAENPYLEIPPGVVNSWPHRQLAIKAAHESVVLLQNRAGVLPLLSRTARVGVVGPNAILKAYGNYEYGNVSLLSHYSRTLSFLVTSLIVARALRKQGGSITLSSICPGTL